MDQSSSAAATSKRRRSWSGSVSEEDDDINKDNIIITNQQNFVSSLIAGVGSGSLASVVCAPLDLVRTRMQVAGGLEAKNAQSQHANIIKSIQQHRQRLYNDKKV